MLNITKDVTFSDTDREEIERHINRQNVSDYICDLAGGTESSHIREYENMKEVTDALEQIISGDEAFYRALQTLRDNTTVSAPARRICQIKRAKS